MNQEEIWKPVVGYEELYEVSNIGRVKSLPRFAQSGNKKRRFNSCILATQTNNKGYTSVTLWRNGKGTRYNVHRLLMRAFVPNPNNHPHIDHINAIKTDNRLENLRWCTAKENANNPKTLKLVRSIRKKQDYEQSQETRRAKNGHNAPIYVYQYSKDGTFVKMYKSLCQAAKTIGADHSNIRRVLNNPTLSAGGYLWATQFIKSYTPFSCRHHPFSKPIAMFDTDGNRIKEWASIYAASKETGIPPKTIRRNATGKSKPRKYIFRFTF